MKKILQLSRRSRYLPSTDSDDFDKTLPNEDKVIKVSPYSQRTQHPHPRNSPPIAAAPIPNLNTTSLRNSDPPITKWFYKGFASTSPEERVVIITNELDVAQTNAKQLSGALSGAQPEDLYEGSPVVDLYHLCHESLKFISSQISWAEREAGNMSLQALKSHPSSGVNYEEILGSMLFVDKILREVLREYDELEEIAVERETEQLDKIILSREPGPLKSSRPVSSSSYNSIANEESKLTNMINYLVTTESEDPAIVMKVCKQASASKIGAMEAVRALERYLRHDSSHVPCAKLWIVMMRNASALFAAQCASPEFLNTIETILSRLPPVTRDDVIDVIAAVAYFNDKEPGFRSLWKKVRPDHHPAEGILFEGDNTRFGFPSFGLPVPAGNTHRGVARERRTINDSNLPSLRPPPRKVPNTNIEPSPPPPYNVATTITYSSIPLRPLTLRLDNIPLQVPIIPPSEVTEITPPPKDSLTDFHRYSSAIKKPVDWLEDIYERLTSYIEQSKMIDIGWLQPNNWESSSILFPHFIVYIYDVVDDVTLLESSVRTWEEWNMLTALCRFKETSDRLRSFINEESGHLPSLPDNEKNVVRNIVALDVDIICARLYGIVKNMEQYRHLINTRGEEAQALLDLFQMLLDLPKLDRIFRGPFMNAMLRLSIRSSLFPSLLLQQQVTLEGTDAITAGQFGDVWKGQYRGRPVAVKVLKLYLNSDLAKHTKKVLHETLIWRQLRHENVLPFLCLHHVNNNEMRIGLVSPWMENGNVKEFLHRTPDVDRVSLVIDIAEGLQYLHAMQPSVVHGDLKAVNILISQSRRARLADFGLSTASDSQALKLSSFSFGMTGGTPRWMAPELLNGTQATNNAQTDVYSFAFVCYEIFSGTIPFPELNDYPVMLKVMQGQRPLRPVKCEIWNTPCTQLGLDDALWKLVERCWAADSHRRPSVHVVVRNLPSRKGRSVQMNTEDPPLYDVPNEGPERGNLIAWAGRL